MMAANNQEEKKALSIKMMDYVFVILAEKYGSSEEAGRQQATETLAEIKKTGLNFIHQMMEMSYKGIAHGFMEIWGYM